MRILPLGKPDMRSRKKGKANRGRSRKLSFLLVMILAAIMALLPLTSMQPASGSPEESQTEATEPDLQAEQTASSGEHYTGCIDSPPDDYPSFSTAGLEPATASSVDLSPYLPPVGDQGGQGSCVAFATGYYMKTGQEKMYDHPQWNLDLLQYRFSPSFIFNQIKVFQYIDPDTGRLIYGSTIPAALEILKEQGDVDVEEMPYNEYDVDTQPTVAQKEAAKPYRISEYTNLWDNTVNPPYNNDTQGGINELKTALANNRPVVMWAYIYDDFPDNGGTPSSLFYDHPGSHELDAGRHALCICGYDDNINPSGADAYHRGGFKIVNSWGADWNSPYNGYLYLSYDFVNRFVNEAWTTEDRTPDSPRITSLSDTIGLQPGGTIHIYGENFGTYRRAAKVTLNGNTVNFGGFNDGEVTISLPSGMTSGAVRVYDWEGTPSNPWSFVTEAPLEEDQIYSNWYFAEGYTEQGFEEYICVLNPGAEAAKVEFRMMNPEGITSIYSYTVAPQQRYTLPVHERFGGEVSVRVVSDKEGVLAMRSMYWKGDGDTKREGHTCRGIAEARNTWYLAEGCTGFGFDEWVLIQNPEKDAAANVTVTFQTQKESETAQNRTENYTVQPHSRFTIHVDDLLPDAQVSTKVESDQPVVVERAMYWDIPDGGGPKDAYGGHCAPGVPDASQEWYLAEGCTGFDFDVWVLIQNPGDKIVDVDVDYMTPDGHKDGPALTLSPGSRWTVHVDDDITGKDVSTHVVCKEPIVVERAMYWRPTDYPLEMRGPGHDSEGVPYMSNKWYLPEGCTKDNLETRFETWVLVQNPGKEPANVSFVYMTDAGAKEGIDFELAGNSRRTVNIGLPDEAPDRWDVSTVVTSDKPVIAEEAMYYFNGQVNVKACLCSVGIPDETIYNTPEGEDIAVGLDEAIVTFAQVNSPGTTILAKTTSPPGGEAPPAYKTICDGQYYQLATSAAYTGNLVIDMGYFGVPDGVAASEIRLFRYDEPSSTWVDITTGFDEVAMTVSGSCSATGIFCVAVPLQRSLVAWGTNAGGALNVPAGEDFTAIDSGYSHCLALRSNGSIAGWGSNGFGETNVPGGNDFTAVSAGQWWSLALRSDGSLVGWGYNGDGQRNVPTGTNFKAVSAGGSFGLALRKDGSLAAWGSNANGQLDVPAGNDFIAISAGRDHALALRSDGTAIGWGANEYNQASFDGGYYTAIAAGTWHSVAIRSDGSLVTRGGWAPDFDPSETPEGNDYVAIAAGEYHSLALRADGTVIGWGMDSEDPNSYCGETDDIGVNGCEAISAGGRISVAIGVRPAPEITFLPVNSFPVGEYDLWLRVEGMGLCPGAQVRLERWGQPDIEATGESVSASNWIGINLGISGATEGAYDMVVRNPDGQEGRYVSGFIIGYTVPAIKSVTPSIGVRDTSVYLVILGTSFYTGATVRMEQGYRAVEPTITNFIHGSRIECRFDLTGLPAGPYDIVVTNADGYEGTMRNAFTVVYPAPTISSIIPNTGAPNTVVDITSLGGTGFIEGASVRLEWLGNVIEASDVSVVSSNQITCRFNLTGALDGNYDVIVRNPDGQECSLNGGFNVSTPPPPCGAGSGGVVLMLGVMLGLLSLASSPRLRCGRRRVRKRK